LFFNNTKGHLDKEKTKGIIKDFTEDINSLECKVWIETLLSIYAERLFKRKPKIKDENLKSELNDHFCGLKSILADECGVEGECYCKETSTRRKDVKEYNSYKDIRNGALFIIAASFKNKPKIYSGFDTLVDASSRVVLHYIETVSEAFNTYLLEEKEDIEPLPAQMQSDALNKMARRFYENIPDTVPHGLAVSQFLKNIGILFRDLQLDTRLNKPYPNQFSLKKKLNNQFEPGLRESDILTEILSYGFLEEGVHRDKNRKKGKRYKYALNRLLCPYFGISIVHRKDPIYIYGQENDFLRCLIQKDCNIETLKSYLSRSTVRGKRKDADLSKYLGNN